MQKIIPFLWFNNKAEQAMKFYVATFKNSKVLSVSRDGKQVFSASFKIEGMEFIAFNGGPHYKFTPAISLFVDCKDQREVDRLWNKLAKGGEKGSCGWIKDKFGISWQIIPKALGKMLSSSDGEKAGRAMQAMLEMGKIDVKKLEKAYK